MSQPTTAPVFEQKAIQYAAEADQMNPPATGDTYEQQRKIIVYHLRTAARLTREIVEHIHKQEAR